MSRIGRRILRCAVVVVPFAVCGLAACGGNTDETGGSVGTECTGDADCRGGLICLASNDATTSSGGPAHGYCTKECDAEPGAACDDLDARCWTLLMGPAKHCLLSCIPGLPGVCHGREDLACMLISGDTGLCVPVCASDDDCDPEFCHPGTGFCVSNPAVSDPIGTPCTAVMSPYSTCKACLGLGGGPPEPGVCSKVCVATRSDACGDGARCIALGTGVAPKPGTLGWCYQSCATDGECLSGSPAQCVPDASGQGVCKAP